MDESLRSIMAVRLKNARTMFNQHGGQTQKEVAEAIGIPVTTNSAMENGKSMDPDNLDRLARYYRVNMDYVFGRACGPRWKGRD